MSTNPIFDVLMSDKVAVPRAILGSICYIVRSSAHADSKSVQALRAYTYGEGIVELPLADVRDPARDLAEAFAKGGFMLTEPHQLTGYPGARKLAIGFQNGDDADAAMQVLAEFLREYGAHGAEAGAA